MPIKESIKRVQFFLAIPSIGEARTSSLGRVPLLCERVFKEAPLGGLHQKWDTGAPVRLAEGRANVGAVLGMSVGSPPRDQKWGF